MKFSAAFTALSVLAVSSFVSAQDIPACVLNCATQAATAAGCSSFADAACVCTSADFQNNAGACLQSCTTAEQQSASALQSALCAGLSVTSGTVTQTIADATGSASIDSSALASVTSSGVNSASASAALSSAVSLPASSAASSSRASSASGAGASASSVSKAASSAASGASASKSSAPAASASASKTGAAGKLEFGYKGVGATLVSVVGVVAGGLYLF
ncbi:hypothetical protein DB88DRAFT_482350 [Papiliotrema laurentii]|uniref:CFEM domain-containing protein n=1 Tax=Papiliotrema laurentii TaxID=5418 RepID=A0AAD9FUZ2_PAPLA|nr:hypothetical protein DB88DRAFT_482350 [Papiliotrema laurentii]